jgi:hypothetical protein
MPKVKGSVRRSQLITTFGVGAILPIGDEAFMVAALERWPVGAPDLHEPRLEREMRVSGFVQPPATDDRPDIPVIRFPTYQSCPICQRLARHGDFTHFDLNDCPDCSQALIPSRFVVACERGHIDDFPYERWVHRGRPQSERRHDLRVSSTGATASLAGVVITCSCGVERSMEDAFDRFALRDVTGCRGRHPWLQFDGESCDAVPRTLQRGASSVWFSDTRSALSIPPWSESASRALDSHWPTLRHLSTESLPPVIDSMKLVEKTGFSRDELLTIADARKRQESGDLAGRGTLRQEEYAALMRGRPQTARDLDFATREGEVAANLKPYIAQLQLAPRLREIRALTGFSRIFPPRAVDSDASNVVSLYDEGADWLPAMEVKGEGLFLRLDGDEVARWSTRQPVADRVALLGTRDRKRHEQWGVPPRRQITPELLLVHILAHALINQLALDAGYPAGSLRERLFADEGACGLLVYTATTDSAGSLGGIIARGERETFQALMHDAIRRFSWCSADPVCIESEAGGVESLNLAACHSCALIPETSCEEMNGFLDRALLVGTPEQPELGFFGGLL